MSKSQFLEKSNINMLWDVIADEDIFKNHTTDIKNTILQLFSDNIKGFYNSESKNSKITLMEMNKKYILMILNFIKTYYPIPTMNKIVIKEEIQLNNKDLFTIEERKKERLTEFDTKLQMVEEEFKNAMTLPVPEIPKFSDNVKEEPVIDMEKAIKEIAQQRNYEIQQINKINNLTQPTQQNQPNQTQQNNLEKNNRTLENKKHIHWEDEEKKENVTINFEEDLEDMEEKDIFSKLKPNLKKQETNNEELINRIKYLEESIENLKKEMNEIKKNSNK
jgi:hypothetical protein